MKRHAWIVAVVLLAGCDNSKRSEAIASVDKPADADAEKREAEARKAKRVADEKAKADAAEKIREQIAAIAVAPEKLPKQALAEACQAVTDAQDRFVKRLQSGEALAAWEAGRDDELAMAMVACVSADSVSVAACQVAGLDAAGPELAAHKQDILDHCIARYAKPRAGAKQQAGAAIPKKPL